MSDYGPPPHKPDSRIFASYPMPAKIDLINERPRRESLEEKNLGHQIGDTTLVPKIEVNSPQQPVNFNNYSLPLNQLQPQQSNRQDFHQHQLANMSMFNSKSQDQSTQQQSLHQQQPGVSNQHNLIQRQTSPQAPRSITTIQNEIVQNKASVLAAELAEKEAKLMAEICAFHQRPYSPFQVPAKIDLTNEQRKAQQQYEHAPPPRPTSQASSTRSTSADLQDKEARLLQEIEEMEKKPFNPQTMIVEREQWFEYPQNRPDSRQMTDSRRRVKDFCSLPSHMYPTQGTHIYEENLPSIGTGRPTSAASSIHTTIIRSPKRDVDNKSPLPFAFDNFTTKGVRGNIASAGAVEPDRPRPPIYPIMKKTPSPNMTRI